MRPDGKPDICTSRNFGGTTWITLEHRDRRGVVSYTETTLEHLLGDYAEYPLEGCGTDDEPVYLPADYSGWRTANMAGPAALAAWKLRRVDAYAVLEQLFNHSSSSYRRGRRAG